jgi:hypothetical protein
MPREGLTLGGYKMRALLLAAATLALIPAAASAAGAYDTHPMHANYAAPHPTYHPPAGHPPMMTYPQHHMDMQRPYTQQQPHYMMQHDNNPYRNPQVYRHPSDNNNHVYASNNHVDRDHDHDRDHGRDFDDHFRHRGYYEFGYPSVTLGYYGGDYYGGAYDGGYAPDAGYAYDQGYYAPQGDGYADQDQGGQSYYDQGYAQDQGDYAAPAEDGYADQGYANQGYAYEQSYAGGYDTDDQPAGPAGRWMWSAGEHRWVWTYCDPRTGYDDRGRW